MIPFILNDQEISTALPAGTTLLDFIRYHQQLTGTKIGCREGDCGACTVLVGQLTDDQLAYTSATSCLMAIGNAAGKHIVTIEGLNHPAALNFIQEAFSAAGATQCGFCTPGFIVSLAGHCIAEKDSTYEKAIDAINGNICRCTGYKSIEQATGMVHQKLSDRGETGALEFAVDQKIIPHYFLSIKERLHELNSPERLVPENSKVKILAGGTDLYVQQHESMVNEAIDFFLEKKELKMITRVGNKCELGASVTVTDIAESILFKEHFPHLHRYVKLISSTQIRNMATVAGNFINASPIGDLTIFFLALDAHIFLSDGIHKREVALRNFYKGYKILDKQPGEWVEKIQFQLPEANDLFNFEKVCKRSWLDIASVNTAIQLRVDKGKIIGAALSAGGVGPVPAFLAKSSEWLLNKNLKELELEDLLRIIQSEISPISDVRGTEQYKRLLLSQLVKAHFLILFPELEHKIFSPQ